ncbi:MAG: hypothetical protein N3H31_01220 [Candidatus Nezhaarchaeota archaeon]|nr:hypothetical protein [Candidatus Nezhaarchaeota archaeon]
MSIELPLNGLVLIYGGGGAGKTSLATSLIKNRTERGERCLYAYTSRLSPLFVKELSKAGDLVSLFRLKDYEEQRLLIRSLYRCRGAGYNLLVFDAFTELYRVFVAKSSDPLKASRLLNQQLAMLSDLASKGILVVLTSRARRLDDDLEPEASNLLNYWVDLMLRLDRLKRPGWRRIIIEKAKTPSLSKLEGLVIETSLWG